MGARGSPGALRERKRVARGAIDEGAEAVHRCVAEVEREVTSAERLGGEPREERRDLVELREQARLRPGFASVERAAVMARGSSR